MNRIILSLCFLAAALSCSADHTGDSLKLALGKATHDTTRCRILTFMIEAENDNAVWSVYNEQLKNICEAGLKNARNEQEILLYKQFKASYYNNQGYLYEDVGNIAKAIEYYEKGLALNESINDKSGAATALNNLGAVYKNQGNIPKALFYYEKSMKLQETVGNKQVLANTLANIGIVYRTQGDINKALEYNNKSLAIQQELGNKAGIANCYYNMGSIYYSKGDIPKALDLLNKSLGIREELKDEYNISASLVNIGVIYEVKGEYGQALAYYEKSLAIAEKIGDKDGMASCLTYIAGVYRKQDQYPRALQYCSRAMQVSKELGFPQNIRLAAELLSDIYKKLGDHRQALEYYQLAVQMRDSIENEKNQKAAIQSQFRYEYEKKAAADSVRVAEEKKVVNARLEKEKTQRFALYGGLFLLLLFTGFMLNRYKVIREQKGIIEVKERETSEQKHLLEEKQKEILDSITYARRLQEAILPPPQFIDGNVPENFILYRPKDIVAGDFYWAEKKGDLFFIAAADSTGHGVPGAMVSVVCSNALNRTVKEFGITDTGKILDKTRELVIETFEKSQSEVKDGMDVSLLCIDRKNRKVQWSGANNPLLLVRSSESGVSSIGIFQLPPDSYRGPNSPIIEIKADKQPIGMTDQPKPFTTHEIEYKEGIIFYLFTDGFADQFGGPNGKKFKQKSFAELLATNSELNMQQQAQLLEKAFTDWKGSNEQVDDVCVIGVRV